MRLSTLTSIELARFFFLSVLFWVLFVWPKYSQKDFVDIVSAVIPKFTPSFISKKKTSLQEFYCSALVHMCLVYAINANWHGENRWRGWAAERDCGRLRAVFFFEHAVNPGVFSTTSHKTFQTGAEFEPQGPIGWHLSVLFQLDHYYLTLFEQSLFLSWKKKRHFLKFENLAQRN